MKSILLSIKPKYVELIASGQKTIEVRKSVPKLDRPFKCYIYCTKSLPLLFASDSLVNDDFPPMCNGKVIGEFVCDRIDEFHEWQLTPSKEFYEVEKQNLDLFLKESCLSYKQACEYRKNLPYYKPLYAWHISNLKIYDKPKELSEFWYIKCTNKRNGCIGCEVKPNCIKTVTRPPQSWCYMEVEE